MPTADAIDCPHCAARIRIKSESILGKKVTCPKCSEPFVAKAPSQRTVKAEKTITKFSGDSVANSSEVMAVACPHCAAKFRMNSASLGKKRSCPKCEEEFTPRASKGTASKTTTAKPSKAYKEEYADEDDDFLKNLSAATKDSRSADVEEEPESEDGEELAPRRSKTKSSTGQKKKRRSSSSSGGGLAVPGILGWVVGGTIGGTLGAAIWVGVGYFTGFEVGWIAWGVGVLTGMGVAAVASANGEADAASGITAAVISILAVLAGKYAVVHLVVDQLLKQVPGVDPQMQQMQQEVKQAVFLNSFGPIDILWFFLAAGSAFKLGSGQQEGD